MATPYAAEYLTLGGLILRSRAIDCPDWHELMGIGEKKGVDLPKPGVAGINWTGRVEGPLRGWIPVKLHGAYDQDNLIVATTDAARRANFWTLLNTVRAVAETNTLQTLTLTTASTTYSADCSVEWMGPPKHEAPWRAEVKLELLLPGGALV